MAGTRPAITITLNEKLPLLLRRRGRFVFGLCWLVPSLNFCVGAQLGYHLGLGLAGHEILDLWLYLFEFRRLFHAFIFDLDHVPAELGLHRIRDLPLL